MFSPCWWLLGTVAWGQATARLRPPCCIAPWVAGTERRLPWHPALGRCPSPWQIPDFVNTRQSNPCRRSLWRHHWTPATAFPRVQWNRGSRHLQQDSVYNFKSIFLYSLIELVVWVGGCGLHVRYCSTVCTYHVQIFIPSVVPVQTRCS